MPLYRVTNVNVPTELKGHRLRVSLEGFIQLLNAAKQFDRRYPELSQVQWLMSDAWAFHDGGALYKSAR